MYFMKLNVYILLFISLGLSSDLEEKSNIAVFKQYENILSDKANWFFVKADSDQDRAN